MRILFCTSQYYPLQLGWAMADYHLSLALARAGHSVFVCTSDTDTLGLQTLQWEGITHNLTSGNTTKEAIEIAPNLFVIGFHIYTEGYLTKGEIVAYRDFVVHFDGDLLFCSGIANAHTLHWACDLLYDLLPTLKVKKNNCAWRIRPLFGKTIHGSAALKKSPRSACSAWVKKRTILGGSNARLKRTLKTLIVCFS
ncbi:hypothetical protein HBZS_111410 [Helicobacter bizzozeronii CCUG 35545]|nr:hypothetical protein HBZS_111410 [Helicobacter bizzozeronii CCUG 35545]